MDSAEFCQLHEVAQINMVAAGEVRNGIMSVPDHDAPLRMCFWCGEMIEILLIGNLTAKQKKTFDAHNEIDAQAPLMLVTDHEPCPECAEKMGRGICIMEAEGKGARAIATGRYWVFTASTIETLIADPKVRESILRKRRALIDKETARALGFYDMEPPERLN